MVNLKEMKILSEQLDKAMDEIINITEDSGQDSKMVFPLYRMMKLKKSIDKSIKKEEGKDYEYTFRKEIRELY